MSSYRRTEKTWEKAGKQTLILMLITANGFSWILMLKRQWWKHKGQKHVINLHLDSSSDLWHYKTVLTEENSPLLGEYQWQRCRIMQPCPDECQSAERRVCHFPERSDSMHCCWGQPAGELSECVCVCLYTRVWMGRGLRGSGMLGWVGIRSCVWHCVCDTMKATTLSSKRLHSWWSSVTGFSAVPNILLLCYLISHYEEQFHS